MAIVNLGAIFAKIRRLTGSSDVLQLPDFAVSTNPNSVGLADYVNSFYLYDFPSQFRSLKLKDKLTFNTVYGVDTYPFDSEKYTTVEMPCYCAKREILLFQEPYSFYGVNFNWQNIENFTFGNGTTGTYSGFAQAIPLIRSVNNIPYYNQQINNVIVDSPSAGFTTVNFLESNFSANQQVTFSAIQGTVGTILNGFTFTITSATTSTIVVPATSTGLTYLGGGFATSAGSAINYPASRVQNILITTNVSNGDTLNVTDDGNGNLIGDAISGIINYATGQISNLVFTQSVPGGSPIQIQYNPVVPTIPLAILFFQNQFTLRPVPDAGYTIELTAYRQPTQALMAAPSLTGTPELSEWWECIAVGASKKIFEDRMDTDGIMMMDKLLKERYNIVYTRTYAQMGSKQRINTIFAQDQQNYGSGPFGFGSGIGGI
jgi:hypothetical protein